jgi:hypothetical protein
MGLVTYNDYISCNMKSYFSKQPGDMICCPMCGNTLTKSVIHASKFVAGYMSEQGLIPLHDFSYLFVCSVCNWWSIRESWDLCEIYQEYDDIAIGVTRKWGLLAKKRASALNEFIERERKLLPDAILDVETAGSIIAEYSKRKRKSGNAHQIGTSETGSAVYLIEDDETWLVFVRQNGQARIVEAIDVLNGIVFCDGQATGMLVSTKAGKNLKTCRVQFLDSDSGLKLLKKLMVEQAEPWLKALEDEKLYINSLNLPKLYGALFVGGQKEVSRK